MLVSILSYFCSLLPRRVFPAIAWFFALLSFDILRIRRRIILTNLCIAFGSMMAMKQRKKIARKSVQSFILTILEFLGSKDGSLSNYVSIVNREYLDEALSKGKGVYLICMHLSNWEAGGAAVNRYFTRAHAFTKKVGNDQTDAVVCKLREKNGFCYIKRHKKGDGIKAVFEILQRNEMVVFVMDQARPGCEKLPFFGRNASTNTSLAAIWRRKKAPILPMYTRRTSDGNYQVVCKPVVNLKVTDNDAQDILDHSVEFNRIVEGCIKECPEQYFWLHNRWKV